MISKHRFWAIAFSLNKLLLYTVPLVIISLLVAINIDSLQYFLYMCIAIALSISVVIFLVIKRVRITLYKDKISIKTNGSKTYTVDIKDFQYARGANISLPKSQGEMNLVFRNKIITFSIFEMRGFADGKTSKHCEILNDLISTYELEDRGQDRKHLSKMHIYWNPRYEK